MKLYLKAFVRPHVRKHPTTGRPVSVSGYQNSKPHSPLPSKLPPFDEEEWIGVDLDRTLAHYQSGQSLQQIGHPIPAMMRRVRAWLKAGRRVKILTARATDPQQIPIIQAWLVKHGLPKLEVTCIKDHRMAVLYDDKAVGMHPNTGKRKDRLSKSAGNTLVLKTHVQGYVKQDGTYVAPHEDKRPPAKNPVEPGPIYYSKLERLLNEKMPNAAGPDQIKGILNGGGVSKEEIEWSQVLDYIDGYTEDGDNRIEKDHLLRFVRKQKVRLDEKVLGRSGDYDEWERQRGRVWTENNATLRELFDLSIGRPTVQVNVKKLTGPITEFELYLQALPQDMHEPAIRFRETDARIHWLDQHEPPSPDGDTKFSQWRLPGGKNYQERLLILSADKNGNLPLGYRVEKNNNGKWTVWNDNGIELGTWPTRESAIKSQQRQVGAKLFESTHFDEPNIVVHIRHDDRIGPNGEKILFVEEAQSDWHQQGKKNGYRLPWKEYERLDVRRQELEAIGIKKRDKGEDVPEAIKQEWADIMNRLQPYNTARVPDAPFKKDWHELVMKRMLREAAEKGYDILAWVSGRITSDRYDLSKHIAQVHTFKQLESSPYSTLVAIDHHGKNILEKEVHDEQIADYVGKDAAEKMLSQKWTSNSNLKLAHKGRYARSISGLDLKIGGEWAVNLYDKMIPQFINKFTKKWDGKVQWMTISTPPVKTDDPETTAIDEDGQVDRTIHALHITPAMRKDIVREGVPLFKSVLPSTVPFPVQSLTVKPGLKGSGYKIDYKTTFQGLPITIENRKGALRHWGNPDDGTAGTTKMEYPYGYIRLTEGVDGDHVDCFLGPNPKATHAYIVHQAKAPDFVQHDEDKVMLGWDSPEDAAAAYLRHYTNPRFFGSMTGMPMDEFKMKVAWTKDRPGIIKSLLTRFRLLWKAAGDERWITVHPHGPGTEGQPVKIRESAGSPGTWHVVGGAGGKLNYLRLTGVKSHEEYKAQAKDRAKEKRAKAKEQLERDKELGLVESKKRVLSELRTDTEKHQRKLIEQVAGLKGWQDYDLKPEQLEGLSDRAKQAAILKHHRKLHRDALAVVRSTREDLLLKAEARAEAGLGELSIHRDEPNILGLTDLSPDPQDRGLGYQPQYGPKSDEIREEAAAFKQDQAAKRDPKKQAAVERMQEVSKEARDEVDQAVESGMLSFGERDTSPVDARSAVTLLAAHKQTQATLKHIQARKRDVQGATQEVQGKSYVIAAEPVSAHEVLQGLMQDAAERTRQDRATSFLKMVEHDPFEERPEDYQGQLTRHIQAGSASMLSRISQQLTGVDILPREVVDVLGTAGASQALALALHTHFSSDQIKTWADQLAAYHAENQGAVTEEAIGRAKEAYEQAQEMVATSADSPSDLAVVHELNEQRITLLRQAREALGTTLGELEAMAAMQYALTAKPATETMVSMGGVSTETAIRQLKALGLEKHDYDIDSDGTNHFALISAEGLGKVVRPIDPEEVQHLQTVDAILDGEHDEPGWVPHGFAHRPTSSYTDPEEQASTYAQPYQYSPQGAHDEDLKRYIGRRMADGHPIHEIYKDLSAGTVLDHLPEDQHEAYFQAFNRVAPLYDERGNAQLADAHRATWERYAEEVLKDQYGDHALPIHRQGIQTDSPKTLEAIHRVMAEDPTRSVAFTNIGDLTPQEQATLRHVFESRFAKHENQEALQQAMEELGPEPAKETDGLFGTQENPEWHQYHNKRAAILQEARANGLNWDKYVALHGSRERAYHAIQDILKGETTAAFQKAYGQVHKTALKLGRTTISNHLSHIDAVNPEAREARLAQHRELVDRLRNRIQGKYSAGSVQDKLKRVREESALLDQNQRSMFGVEPEDESVEKPLEADERHTLGHTVESQLTALWPQVSRNFDPQRPVNLMVDKRMDGKYVGQQRAIKLIEHNKRMALALGTGSGKAQPLDAKVLTPSGWKLMGEIQAGDLVIASDGTATKVLAVFPQGEKAIYAVIMSDGSATETCDDHLWLTQTWVERRNYARAKDKSAWLPKTRMLKNIRATLKHRGGQSNHAIPMVQPVFFDPQYCPVDPYLLGLLLGDGSLSVDGTVGISLPDAELKEAVQQLLPLEVSLHQQAGSAIDYTITTGRRGGNIRPYNPILEGLRDLGLMGVYSASKHVPAPYKYNSVQVRLSVLNGLLDTDGHVAERGMSVYFDTASKALSDDITFLVQSLGGITSCVVRTPKFTYNGEHKTGQPSYRMTISLPPDIVPFRLARKRDKVIPKTKYKPIRYIADVHFSRMALAQCITIDHPSGLYVTDDFIVTHNTSIGLGAFTHLYSQGKVKRGVFAVPSIVQAQFGGEAAANLEPGKYSWWGKPGANRDERIAALKDPQHHMVITTHQSLRDDLVHLMAQQKGMTDEAMADHFQGLSEDARSALMQETLRAEGIRPEFFMLDEGHDALNRKGKADSLLSNVLDAFHGHLPYYISSSADPMKNDLSELYSQLHKIDPKKFNHPSGFMSKYGVQTNASMDVLRRELRRYLLPGKVDPGVQAIHHEDPVALTEAQQSAYDQVMADFRSAREAHQSGKLDLPAAKRLSPSSFEGQDASTHAHIAKGLHENLGIVRDGALERVLNDHDPSENAKVQHVVQLANQYRAQKKPGIIFARSRKAVDHITQQLASQGHRVLSLTGSDTAKEKAKKIAKFRPPPGREAEADIMVLSDAGATGANLQRGQWITHYDIPHTSKTWHQRTGRIHRLGQQHNVHVHTLITDTRLDAKKQQRINRKHGLRAQLTAPYESLSDHHDLYTLLKTHDDT